MYRGGSVFYFTAPFFRIRFRMAGILFNAAATLPRSACPEHGSVRLMRHLIPMRALAGCALAIALAAAAASGATAQTLTNPHPHPTPSRPAAGKSTAARHTKACPEFGAGFYRADGSDTCIKIGGFIEAGVSSRH
jgi:hypothetical protein